TAILSEGLLALEGTDGSPAIIEPMMRAAHSLKGAARIVGVVAAVRVAHAMEDCFVAAQSGKIKILAPHVDILLRAVDLLARIAPPPPAPPPAQAPAAAAVAAEQGERVVRVTAESLTRLMGLAGESLVQTRQLRPFVDSLLTLKARQTTLLETLQSIEDRRE